MSWKCPICGDDTIEVVQKNATVTWRLRPNASCGWLMVCGEYDDDVEIHSADTVRYQCDSCGYVLPVNFSKEDAEPKHEELSAYLAKFEENSK